jgi:hypothetical protein
VAAGHPGLISGDMVRRGVVVVDVGINVVDGAIVGDVDFESVRRVASAITPVPGGVGPLTNALLLAHLVRAARAGETESDAAVGASAGAAPSPSPVPPHGSTDAPSGAPATVSGDSIATSRGVR